MPVNAPALLIEPPYVALRPVGTVVPPLGSILLADLRLGMATVESAVAARSRAPWCPIAVVVPPQPSRLAELALGQLPPHLVPVSGQEGEGIDPEAIRRATERRPAPGAAELARYAALRIGGIGLAPVLETCFHLDDPNDEPFSERMRPVPPSTVSRRLRASGPLTCHDWRNLARIVDWHCRTIEGPPGLAGWIRRYLDMASADVTLRAGWEWIVELALRRWGYVQDPESRGGDFSTAVRGRT